jgi:hypothetical protein
VSDVRAMTVCLSKTAATHQAPTAVSALLAAHGITDAGLTRHFRTTTPAAARPAADPVHHHQSPGT